MVDFTKEIQQTRKTAAQTPQFAPPSSSLGGDIVNAVGTGLQFFQQQQAKTELQELTQKQAAQERMLSEGIMGYREQRQNLMNQGVSRLQLAEHDKKFLSKYSPEMQYEIVSAANKLTGTNLYSMSDSISAKEKEARDAEAQVRENRIKLEDAAAQSLASMGMSVAEIESMTEEELRDIQLQGMITKTEEERKAAELSRKIASGQYEKMTAAQKEKEYIALAIPSFRNTLSSSVLTTIDNFGGFGKAMELGGKEALMDSIQRQRASIPQLLEEQARLAKEAGVHLTLDQQAAFKQAAKEEIDRAEMLISDESYVKLFDAQNDRMLRDGLFKMSMSNDPIERGAAISALMMMSSNIPLGDVEKSAIAKITSRSIAGELKFDGEDGTATPQQKVKVITEKIKVESIGGGYSEEDKQQNAKIIENSLLSTPTEVNAFANAGGINKLAGAIAATEGKSIPKEKYPEIQEALFAESYKRVTSAQMRAVNTKSQRLESIGGAGRDKVFVSTDVLTDFTLDPETGLLVRVDNSSYVIPDAVKTYNSYMKDLFKSFEVLGVDEYRIKDFKDNAMKSMMILQANNK